MLISTVVLALLVYCLLLAAVDPPAVAQPGDGTRHLPPRDLPLPATVSPELQQLICQPLPAQADVPTTREGWEELREVHDEPLREIAEVAARQRGVRIERLNVAGVNCHKLTPQTIAADKKDALFFHVHGGAYVFNVGVAGAGEGVLLADACKLPAISVDYRMPPDHFCPTASDDVFTVWKQVIKTHAPERIVAGGTSAGGALMMMLVQQCRAEGVPLPAAIFLGTPGADNTKTGDSWYIMEGADQVLRRYEGIIQASLELYANGRDLKDPLVSPLYGDLSGFPPTVLISGTRDLLLSATVRTHRQLRAAGIVAELHVYEGMSHADYLIGFDTPEGKDALGEVAAFFDRHL